MGFFLFILGMILMVAAKGGMENTRIITRIIVFILGALIFIYGLIDYWGYLDKLNSKSSYDNLSQSEKDYLQDSYGDGKMDAINDAIGDYKDSH